MGGHLGDVHWFIGLFYLDLSTICRSYPGEIRFASHWHEFHRAG